MLKKIKRLIMWILHPGYQRHLDYVARDDDEKEHIARVAKADKERSDLIDSSRLLIAKNQKIIDEYMKSKA